MIDLNTFSDSEVVGTSYLRNLAQSNSSINENLTNSSIKSKNLNCVDDDDAQLRQIIDRLINEDEVCINFIYFNCFFFVSNKLIKKIFVFFIALKCIIINAEMCSIHKSYFFFF